MSTERLCLRRSRFASRNDGAAGSRATSDFCAAARQASSVSAALSTTISEAVWPRSTASEPSVICPGAAARRCMPWSRLDRRGDRGAVEALAADDDEAAQARLASVPGPVEIMLQPRADTLHHLAKILAGHMQEAFQA